LDWPSSAGTGVFFYEPRTNRLDAGRYQPPPGDEGFTQRLALWDALLAACWAFLMLRWLWSLHNGPDRERLSMPQAQGAELLQQMVALIERAERFYKIQPSIGTEL
jgi:hypothetical protein